MEAFDRVLLVANPTSGIGKARRRLDGVAAAMRRGGWNVEELLTRDSGDAREAVAAMDGSRPLAVAFGGDGTFNELLNGADLARCTLAIIPAGTGNVLAKELGMSRLPGRAARQLLKGRTARFDVGLCNGRKFISVFGAGVDARAVQLVHRSRGSTLTQLHYLPHVLRSALEAPGLRIEVELDGEPFAQGVCQVSAGNTSSYGGPIQVTPAAAPDDGLLDLMCLEWEGLAEVPVLVGCALLRSLHLSERIRYGRGTEVLVRSEQPGVPYEVDGEAAGTLPARIELKRRAVCLLAPAGFQIIRKQPPAQ